MTWFFALKTYMLDLLFPAQCCGCGTMGTFLCGACAGTLAQISPQCFVCHAFVPITDHSLPGRTCVACRPHSSVYLFLSPFSYQQNIMRELVHSLKYRRSREIAAICSDMMISYLAAMNVALPQNALLVPIPLHKTRQRLRGFNQSFLISQSLGEKLGIEVGPNLLKKIKKTAPQMELFREERLKNLNGTFAVLNPLSVQGKTIILVDDVKTTGATLEEAARLLKQAGTKQVWALTVAH